MTEQDLNSTPNWIDRDIRPSPERMSAFGERPAHAERPILAQSGKAESGRKRSFRFKGRQITCTKALSDPRPFHLLLSHFKGARPVRSKTFFRYLANNCTTTYLHMEPDSYFVAMHPSHFTGDPVFCRELDFNFLSSRQPHLGFDQCSAVRDVVETAEALLHTAPYQASPTNGADSRI